MFTRHISHKMSYTQNRFFVAKPPISETWKELVNPPLSIPLDNPSKLEDPKCTLRQDQLESWLKSMHSAQNDAETERSQPGSTMGP
jgi:hypothetical protein